jgi:hypothetical protein
MDMKFVENVICGDRKSVDCCLCLAGGRKDVKGGGKSIVNICADKYFNKIIVMMNGYL